MPWGRFALGFSKEEPIPKGYKKKNLLIPLFTNEKVITIGTEPFESFDTAEEFRKVIKPSDEFDINKIKKRKRNKKQFPLMSDPLMQGFASPSPPAPEKEPAEQEEEDVGGPGLFGGNPDAFF